LIENDFAFLGFQRTLQHSHEARHLHRPGDPLYCLSICQSIYDYVTCISVNLFSYLFLCLSVYRSIFPPACLSVCPSTCLPLCLSVSHTHAHALRTCLRTPGWRTERTSFKRSCTAHYIGVTVVLQCWYSGVAVVLQWCNSGVTVVLQWCYSGITGYSSQLSYALQQNVDSNFQKSTQTPGKFTSI
jgi:hypothetical protein